MMDNGTQDHYINPISSSVEPRTSNMYILQVKPSGNEGSLEADAIPLHLLINEQDPQHQYFIPVVQGKQLQLYIDSREHAGTNVAHNQFYSITEPQITNNEVQIMDIRKSATPCQEHILQTKTEASTLEKLPSIEDRISNMKASHNAEQKKRVIQKFVHISDRVVPPRAVAVLPGALQLRHGVVSPRAPLPARVRFGPVQGIKHNLSTEDVESLKLAHCNSKTPLFLLKTEDGTHTHIDVSDNDKSNWLSLLPLGDQSTANVWLYEEDHQLYAATIKTIPARVPLALGYSKEYVDTHQLPVEEPVLDLQAELSSNRQWWCHECQRSMATAALLQRHMDVYHTEQTHRPRRYRCLHCTRSFCRLFTLRRHMARHCTKKGKEDKNNDLQAVQSANGILDTSKPDDLELSMPPAEDSRLPSDESLQTLTNNLDFSTNLFDTDRINLDMSGSSRSEDFNYSLGLKDDMALAAGIDFGMDEACSKKEVRKENTEPVFLTCRYCNQAVIRGRQRQHVKACTGRKFHCECGRSFLYKDKLALHIHVDHPNLTSDQRRRKNTNENELQYKCEMCNLKFKRRGMLVNHLWRVHKTLSTAVPLEKKVRHYPCVTCPKVYRTAAKRDSHVRIHHPGSSLSGIGTSIEGGRVACAPAVCSACPRQYASRAKLLQHVRLHHPELAPPVKRKLRR
ncbi:PR domain zinc finger protein 10-like [Leguminivora glycinivorella]|uniref:PR domain zinc finger protein 10-like n=1 Tax=Leguminivora glycinivorella TaxID=1035111 RepID=UPI00200BF5E5|nr:PR domain zinc finger protein 10-like [Leguminivora glycinivorella]